MEELRRKRELAGLSQIALSQQAGVSRMRLQLAETGQLILRADEVKALNHALRMAMESRAEVLRNALDSVQARF